MSISRARKAGVNKRYRMLLRFDIPPEEIPAGVAGWFIQPDGAWKHFGGSNVNLVYTFPDLQLADIEPGNYKITSVVKNLSGGSLHFVLFGTESFPTQAAITANGTHVINCFVTAPSDTDFQVDPSSAVNAEIYGIKIHRLEDN